MGNEDRREEKCIGSAAELKTEIEKSVKAGFMKKNPLAGFMQGITAQENYEKFDLHRPFVDDIILVSDRGKTMMRETDLIDVWFDSGAMPYAQAHYPFENKENFDTMFPADYIAEGVDQTRGWFFTLHAIATMISDSVLHLKILSPTGWCSTRTATRCRSVLVMPSILSPQLRSTVPIR